MIIDLHKILFFGAKEELNAFFERAQKEGIIQFLSQVPKKGAAATPPDVQGAIEALKILRKQPLMKGVKRPYTAEHAEEVVDRILKLQKEIDRFGEESRQLEADRSRVAPLGPFSMEEIAFLEREAKLLVQFFCVKSKKASQMELSSELIYLGSEYDLNYFMTLSRQKKSFRSMIEVHVERPVQEIAAHLQFVHETLHELESELKGFAGYIEYLRRYLAERLDDYHLYEAKRSASYPLDETLFSIEGWVAVSRLEKLRRLTKGFRIAYERIAIEPSDRVPTCMENRGVNHIGEDLVNIYDTPAPEDRDPSPWLYWFFALFFAVIVSDAGYGLLYLGLALFLKFKFPHLKGKMRRMHRLLGTLAVACIGWGVITGSFFGIEWRGDSAISRASLFSYLAEKKGDYHVQRHDEVYREWADKIPAVQGVRSGEEMLQKGVQQVDGKEKFVVLNAFKDVIFLEISLLLGVIHLGLSLVRYMLRNWANFGWFLALLGGYLYFPLFLKGTSLLHFLGLFSIESVGLFGAQLMLCGVALAVILALFQKRLKGMFEIVNVVQLFGDVLSYLRLYALGLAGAIMAQTTNELGSEVGLFFGILVMVFGHSVNITLGIMSGVIHGLRLNFIEWYHYSYIGGGKLFTPLKKLRT